MGTLTIITGKKGSGKKAAIARITENYKHVVDFDFKSSIKLLNILQNDTDLLIIKNIPNFYYIRLFLDYSIEGMSVNQKGKKPFHINPHIILVGIKELEPSIFSELEKSDFLNFISRRTL